MPNEATELLGDLQKDAQSRVLAFRINLVVSVCSLLCFSVVIPDSIDLSAALDRGISESGLAVSIYRLGTAIGAVLIWVLGRQRPTAWRDEQKAALLAALTTALLGSAGYTAAATMASQTHGGRECGTPTPCDSIWAVLLVSRALTGIADGVTGSLTYLTVIHLFPAKERPGRFVVWQTLCILAMGVGPMIAAATAWTLHGTCFKFTGAGVAQCCLLLVALAAVAGWFPSLHAQQSLEEGGEAPDKRAEAPDKRAEAPEKGEGQPTSETNPARARESYLRAWLIGGSLLCIILRVLLSAATEVGTATILQLYLHVTRANVGLCIGAAFMTSALVYIAYTHVKGRLSELVWIRLFAAASLLAGFLTLRSPWAHLGWSDTAYAVQLLIADVITFSSTLYSVALIIGLQTQHLLPRGSLFDATHMSMWNIVIMAGVGRFGGPVVGRAILEGGVASVDVYALALMALMVAGWIAFEAAVAWPLILLRRTRQ